MTDYTPTVWVDDVTKLSAANMNHLEQGVAAAQTTASDAIVAPADPDTGVIPYFDGTEWTVSDAPGPDEAPVFDGTDVVFQKLTDANIASGAGIKVAKLEQGTTGQVLRMVGSTPTWSGALKTATSVPGLGTGLDGSLGLIRAGSSPYDMVALVYDATYGKWVSQSRMVVSLSAAGPGLTSSTYATQARVPLEWKNLDSAGLTAQVRLMGRLVPSSDQVFARVAWLSADAGADEGAATAVTGSEISKTTSGTVYKDSGWQPLGTASAKDLLILAVQVKNNDNGTTVSFGPCSLQLRWVG